MGDLISLDERRAARSGFPAGTARHGHVNAPVRFWFMLGSPWTYLAAERVERLFGGVVWQPVAADDAIGDAEREAVERRACQLNMPLVWPEEASSSRAARRVAALAAEHGCAAAFVLATGRLAFCGGYDLDDPEILAEAAAAAGLGLEEALEAAGDRDRDGELDRGARLLAARGAEELPALSVAGHLFGGEHRIPEAAAAFADLRSVRGSRPVPTRDSR